MFLFDLHNNLCIFINNSQINNSNSHIVQLCNKLKAPETFSCISKDVLSVRYSWT